MSKSEPTHAPQPRSSGLGIFFLGLAAVVIDAVIVGLAAASGFMPDDRTAIAIWAFGGIGLLMMLLGMLKGFFNVFRSGSIGPFALQLVIVLAIAGAGYFGWTLWNGVPVPGDELATLVGKKRDDPAVKSAMGRLGLNHYDSSEGDKVRLGWNSGVEFRFDRDNTLDSVSFRINEYHPYRAGLPAALTENDTEEDLEKKLGPPDSEENEPYKRLRHYKSKNLALEWRLDSLLGPRWEYIRVVRTAP